MQAIPVLILMIVVLAAGRWSDDFDKGSSALAAGQLQEATAHYTKALRSGELSEANRARAYNNRGVALDRQGRYGEAVQDFEMALRVKPNDMEVMRNRGVSYAHAQSTAAADAPKVIGKARTFGFL